MTWQPPCMRMMWSSVHREKPNLSLLQAAASRNTAETWARSTAQAVPLTGNVRAHIPSSLLLKAATHTQPLVLSNPYPLLPPLLAPMSIFFSLSERSDKKVVARPHACMWVEAFPLQLGVADAPSFRFYFQPFFNALSLRFDL